MNLSDTFMSWLEQTPQALAKFVDVATEWYASQGKLPSSVPDEGFEHIHIGDTPEMRTKGISPEDLDALYQGYAEATVKQEALAYVKGFITGVMFVL